MKRAVLTVVLAACSARPPTPTRQPAPPHADIGLAPPREGLAETPATRTLTLERPDALFASLIADPEPVLRWPLPFGLHPELEPSFEIAGALAEPGIGWLELCRMGAQHRTNAKLRELTLYLRAWCEVGADDRSAALATLKPLTSSVTAQLAAAVRTDIVNILAAGDADDAEELMTTHKLFSLDRLDTLAATFVELGKEADAFAINKRALDSDRVANRASTCRRLSRAAMLAPPDQREKVLEELHAYAVDMPKDPAEPVCVALYDEVGCWLEQQKLTTRPSCGAFWSKRGLSANAWGMYRAYRLWPPGAAGPASWLGIARQASQSLEVPGADKLALDALEATVVLEECSGHHVLEARTIAGRVANTPRPTQSIDDTRLRRIIDSPQALCANP